MSRNRNKAVVGSRREAAQYYDLQPSPYEGRDIPFYISLVPSPKARILELGCGTGRVLLPLAAYCSYIHGIDLSEGMISICQKKIRLQNIPTGRAYVQAADICDFELGQTFDLIVAPFRVFQSLETDEQLTDFFRSLHKHLSEKGTCVLNAFRPFPGELTHAYWKSRRSDVIQWEKNFGAGSLVCYERVADVDATKLICYYVISYRYYQNGELHDEAVFYHAVRCYEPDEFKDVITKYGFKILNEWGGYSGEPYGEGPELVIQFSN